MAHGAYSMPSSVCFHVVPSWLVLVISAAELYYAPQVLAVSHLWRGCVELVIVYSGLRRICKLQATPMVDRPTGAVGKMTKTKA